jgi:site-specific DNA recombinase
MSTVHAASAARGSSAHQAEAHTGSSPLAALHARGAAEGLAVPEALPCSDARARGATLVRPALERGRELVAAGAVDRLDVHAPDRWARPDAYQVVLVEAWRRRGVAVLGWTRDLGRRPADALLLPVQGLRAEDERAQRLERQRRGTRHAARAGAGHVLRGAPYGDRYGPKPAGGGHARAEVVAADARVVRQGCDRGGRARLPIGAGCRRLTQAGALPRTATRVWARRVGWGLLKHPASRGRAAVGKPRHAPRRPRRRAQRGRPRPPRRPVASGAVLPGAWIPSPVPAIVEAAVCAAVPEQLRAHQRQARHSRRGARSLLHGVGPCQPCSEAVSGTRLSPKAATGKPRADAYSRGLGTEAARGGGERVGRHPPGRTDLWDLAVGRDGCGRLAHPERLAAASRRRLHPQATARLTPLAPLDAQRGKRRQGLARVSDRDAEGLRAQHEREPRRTRLRQRIAPLDAHHPHLAEAAALQPDVPLMSGRRDDVAARLHDGVEGADWTRQRELIRALVKRVDVDHDPGHVVFRIEPPPEELGSEKKSLQACRRRTDPPVRRAPRGRIPLVLCPIARVQPLPEPGLLHRDSGQPPRMAELVTTRVAVACSHPWRGGLVRQHPGPWPTGVRRRASGTTPRRVRIGPRFGDGFERQHVEGVPGPITPRRHPDIAWAAGARGHGDAAQREWAPALMLEVCHGWRCLLRGVPRDVLPPRRAFAPVGRHSRDGHGTAAPRAGETVGPGPDLAPLPLPLCRHATDLPTTPGPLGAPPVALVPVPPGTPARASRCHCAPPHARLFWPRPPRFACATTTRQAARVRVGCCRSYDVAQERHPSLRPDSAAVACAALPSLHPLRRPSRSACPASRAGDRRTTFHVRARVGEVSPLRRGSTSCARCVRRPET